MRPHRTPAPRPELSASLANRSLCAVLAGFATRAKVGWKVDGGLLPLVEIFETRYALSGDLVNGWLYSIPATSQSRPALIARDGEIFAAGRNAGDGITLGRRVVATLEDVRYVIPGGGPVP